MTKACLEQYNELNEKEHLITATEYLWFLRIIQDQIYQHGILIPEFDSLNLYESSKHWEESVYKKLEEIKVPDVPLY